MHELEEGALGHPLLTIVRVVNLDFEMRVWLAGEIRAVPGCELGVGRHGWASYVVRQKSCVGRHVAEANHVVVSHDSTSTSLWDFPGRLDDPVIVCIVQWMERIAGDLLTRTRDAPVVVFKRITIQVRVQVCLGIFVFEHERVIVSDLCALTDNVSIRSRSTVTSARDLPSEFIVSGLSSSVCWKAGLMNSSPVPDLLRTLKWTQNQKR